MIIIVGAGLSGLVCARILYRAEQDVLIVDSETAPGGRLQTRVTRDGYRLDRGFQVLFAAYPALRRHVRLSTLDPRYFVSGLDVAFEGRRITLGHPVYAANSIASTIAGGLVGPRDVVALARLLGPGLSLGDAPLPAGNRSALDAMRSWGFSESFIRHVLVPLFGGISLDRSVSSDAVFLQFVLRAMALGRIFLPAAGIGDLPRHLAELLPPRALALDTRVEALLRDGARIVGVRSSRGEIPADAVVVATGAPEAARLTGVSLPSGRRSCTTVYFESRRPLCGRRLLVNGNARLVNHVVQLSAISPAYAPPGRHLLAAVVPEEMRGTNDEVVKQVADDLETWNPPERVRELQALDVVRVPYSQFAQPPGVYSSLPGPIGPERGLFLAGEYLHSSSTQGAIRGGEMAAAAVLTALA